MRCQKGDIAYIVSPYMVQEARGRVVQIKERAAPKECFACRDGSLIFIHTGGAQAWVVSACGPEGVPGLDPGQVLDELAIDDNCLLPIGRRPEALDERASWERILPTLV